MRYLAEARKINRLIHLKYVTPEALNDPTVASNLSKGDDVTVKVHMDRLISWNLNDSCWDGYTQRRLVPPTRRLENEVSSYFD